MSLAGGTGEPFAYSWWGGYTQSLADGFRWLHVATPNGLQAGPFAADWALWALTILLVFYVIGLNGSREHSGPPRQLPSDPTPAAL